MSKQIEVRRSGIVAAIQLTAELETFAVGQIKAFEADYKKAKAGIGNMSNHLLTLAKRAEKDGGEEKRDALFKALCRHAETVYKQQHLGADGKERPIKTLLPFWPVAKSQVQAGLNAGLWMADFKTVYELTEATPKKERAPRTTEGESAGGESDDSGSVSMPKGAHGDALKGAYIRLNRLLKALVTQRPELIAAAAVAIVKLCDSLEEMADIEEQAETKGAQSSATRPDAGVPREQTA